MNWIETQTSLIDDNTNNLERVSNEKGDNLADKNSHTQIKNREMNTYYHVISYLNSPIGAYMKDILCLSAMEEDMLLYIRLLQCKYD